MNAPARIPTSLARLAAPSPLTAAEWQALERRLWEVHRRIIVGPGDGDLRPEQRSVVEAIGEYRFGER